MQPVRASLGLAQGDIPMMAGKRLAEAMVSGVTLPTILLLLYQNVLTKFFTVVADHLGHDGVAG
jgi:hypothetical protein